MADAVFSLAPVGEILDDAGVVDPTLGVHPLGLGVQVDHPARAIGQRQADVGADG